MSNFNGLSTVNVELTSRCNKACWMCGRREVDREKPELANYGDMDVDLIISISNQLPRGVIVQFHNNGEPLLYPDLDAALVLFTGQIRCLDTNGKLLVEKANDVIGHLDTIAVSIFEGDPEQLEQYLLLERFMKLKGGRPPRVIARILGNVKPAPYIYIGCWPIAKRVLHNPMGSFDYKKEVTIPEIGICLDMLTRMSIRWDGKVSHCVRFDPEGLGIIGDATKQSLDEIWNGEVRRECVKCHIEGRRDKVPLCEHCDYWGCPTG